MHLINFLNLILPQDGVKCWVSIKNKVVRQNFTQTLEELAAAIEGAREPGLDIYHACATFKDATSRRGQNALMCKAFWLDIDLIVKGVQVYADSDSAVQAVDEFANRLGVPLPLCVHSGRGIHAYWPHVEPLPAQRWTETARILKRAAEVLGLHADDHRTADISSVLRPPGTVNTKNGAIVECDGECEPVEYEAFKAACERGATGHGGQDAQLPTSAQRPSVAGAVPHVVSAGKTVSSVQTSNILGGLSGPPSFTQGYPDGERTAELARRAGHLLATGHSYDATLAACKRWNLCNTPPLPETKIIHDVASYAKREAEKQKAVAPPPEVKATLPVLPWGYFFDEFGALCTHVKEGDDKRKEVISPYTIFLSDVCRRESEVHISYIFHQWHPHNGWHQFAVPADEMAGKNWAGPMAKNGANIISPLFKAYVSKAAIKCIGERMDAIQYEQFGWKNDDTAFLVGNSLVRNDGTTAYAYGDKALEPRMQAMKLPRNSSFERWRAAANKFYQPGFEALGFGLLASFAAPLIRFLVGNTDGGAILALYSEDTGFGKSKILEGIASVWGAYDALSLSGKDTINAKFNIISKACHLPVYEEELRERDPLVAADFVKDFTMGRDKNRLPRDGTVAFKNSRYQTIMISASNLSLLDALKQSGDKGAVARVFELSIDMPEGLDFKYLRDISGEMSANCGHAGRAIAAVMTHAGFVPWVKQALRTAEEHYIRTLETQPEHRYVVWLLAACKVMAEVVNVAGILSFDTSRIMQWAETKAVERIKDISPPSKTSEVLSQYINEHFTSDCLIVAKEWIPKTPATIIRFPDRKLTMRMERDNNRLYIAVEPLKKWLRQNRIDPNTLLKNLISHKVVLDSKKYKSLGAGTEIAPGQVCTWEVDTAHPSLGGETSITIAAAVTGQVLTFKK